MQLMKNKNCCGIELYLRLQQEITDKQFVVKHTLLRGWRIFR